MIIDCHGHYTTMPDRVNNFRKAQLEAFEKKEHDPDVPICSDDEIRETLVDAQLKMQAERGTDITIFSPRASMMGHHQGDAAMSERWSRISNNLIHHVVRLYPKNFVGVCQLPQSPGTPASTSVGELERCVKELGFIGCLISPDASGGYWKDGIPITDKSYYPLYEKMVELDVPGMVHVTASCNPAVHFTGAHYMNADTTAFMQLITSDLCKDFPTLRLIIPHGGGAVPYHWGRYRGLALDLKRPPLEEMIKNNVFFDTCVYHYPGIELLHKVIPTDNILFATEMIGAVRGKDPNTGHYFDDTKRYVDQLKLSAADQQKIFEGNTRKVFPRINKVLGN